MSIRLEEFSTGLDLCHAIRLALHGGSALISRMSNGGFGVLRL
jgi:hypothetical protein